nr:hypothetical protein [Candidatus Woesebacteria bacterium]
MPTKIFVILQFFFLLSYYQYTRAAVYCPAINEVKAENSDYLFDSQKMKQHQIMFAQRNMRLFCEKNMTLRYLRVNKAITSEQCLTLPLSTIKPFVSNFEKTQSVWHLSLVPQIETKKLAAQKYHFLNENFDSLIMYESDALKNLPQYFNTIRNKIDALQINNKAADVSAKSNIKKFCYGETLLPRNNCTKQMLIVKDKMAPKGPYTDMTDRNLWKRILTTTNYDLGLIEANRIISQNISTNNSSSDVFSDLTQGFVKTGSNQFEASQKALDILGIMSNHGPNIAHYLSTVVNSEQFDKKYQNVPLITKGTLIARIGSVIPYYDYVRMNNNAKLYSYPKNI